MLEIHDQTFPSPHLAGLSASSGGGHLYSLYWRVGRHFSACHLDGLGPADPIQHNAYNHMNRILFISEDSSACPPPKEKSEEPLKTNLKELEIRGV